MFGNKRKLYNIYNYIHYAFASSPGKSLAKKTHIRVKTAHCIYQRSLQKKLSRTFCPTIACNIYSINIPIAHTTEITHIHPIFHTHHNPLPHLPEHLHSQEHSEQKRCHSASAASSYVFKQWTKLPTIGDGDS